MDIATEPPGRTETPFLDPGFFFAPQLLRETRQRDRRDGWRAARGGWPEQRAVRGAGETTTAEGAEEQCDSAEQYPGETVGRGQHRFRG